MSTTDEPSLLVVGLLIFAVVSTKTVGYAAWRRGYVSDGYETTLLASAIPVFLFASRSGGVALAAVAAHAAVGLYGLVAWLVVRSGGPGAPGTPKVRRCSSRSAPT